jgi:acyl carrier protein
MEIQTAVRGYIVDEVLKGNLPDGFDDDYELIETGIIDSLSTMNLIVFLEQNHAVVFGINEIVPRHFRSVNALSTFVRSKKD